MIFHNAVVLILNVLIFYFVLQLLVQLVLGIRSLLYIQRARQYRQILDLPRVHPDFMPSVSLVVPVYNEQANVVSFVKSVCQLDYPDYEIVLINDGSTDGTLEALISQFDLTIFQEVSESHIETEAIRASYRSPELRNLRVIDKAHGGRADTLNAGINAALNHLICVVDPKLTIEEAALKRTVRPFLDNKETVASSGIVIDYVERSHSGDADMGRRVPGRTTSLFQGTSNLRRSMIGEFGMSTFNSVFSLPAAFTMFSKESLIEVGGYRPDTVDPDAEILVRVHREYRQAGKPYRIACLPEIVGWIRDQKSISASRVECIRQQQGLAESLTLNKGLLFSASGGAPGWFTFPYFILSGWLYPIVETVGLLLVVVAYALNVIPGTMVGVFFLVTIGFQILVSLCAVLLLELAVHPYTRLRSLIILVSSAILENIGYRQLCLIWRIAGLIKASSSPGAPRNELAHTGTS